MNDRLALATGTGLPWVTLVFKVVMGVVALTAGSAALAARKGGTWHRRSGVIFVVTMIDMGLSAVGIAMYEGKEDVASGVLAAYLVFTAWTTVRPLGGAARAIDPLGGAMSIHTFYRVCLWLPILLPAALIAVASAFDLRLAQSIIGETIAYSLIYGGLPYAALAGWATWWVGGRPEDAIRRVMWRAPLLMVALYVPLALLVGLVVGAVGPFAGVALVGTVVTLLLGYAYVGLTLFLRLVLVRGSPAP